MQRTIQAILHHSSQALINSSDTPQLDAALLMQHSLGVTRSFLYTHPQQTLTDAQLQAYQAILSRRIAGEPIAYILGYKEFWSLTLKVTPATLIPRPETELL